VGVLVEVSMNWIPKGVLPEVVLVTNDATGAEIAADTGMLQIRQTMRARSPTEIVFINHHILANFVWSPDEITFAYYVSATDVCYILHIVI
jgi:hypothetical protein